MFRVVGALFDTNSDNRSSLQQVLQTNPDIPCRQTFLAAACMCARRGFAHIRHPNHGNKILNVSSINPETDYHIYLTEAGSGLASALPAILKHPPKAIPPEFRCLWSENFVGLELLVALSKANQAGITTWTGRHPYLMPFTVGGDGVFNYDFGHMKHITCLPNTAPTSLTIAAIRACRHAKLIKVEGEENIGPETSVVLTRMGGKLVKAIERATVLASHAASLKAQSRRPPQMTAALNASRPGPR